MNDAVLFIIVLVFVLGPAFAIVNLLIALAIKRDSFAYDNEYLWSHFGLTASQLGFRNKGGK
jgi:hypothetical protein